MVHHNAECRIWHIMILTFSFGMLIGIIGGIGMQTLKTRQMIWDLQDSYTECREQLSNR